MSVDKHTIRGKFTFKVAAAAATPTPAPAGVTQTPSPSGPAAGVQTDPAAPAGVTDEGQSTAAEKSTITWLNNLVRWLAYLAVMTLFGGFATRLFVLGPAFEGGGNGDATTATVCRTVSLLRAGVALLLPTLFVALALQSSSVNGVGLAEALSPLLLGVVVTKTGYGTAWLVTALAAAA